MAVLGVVCIQFLFTFIQRVLKLQVENKCEHVCILKRSRLLHSMSLKRFKSSFVSTWLKMFCNMKFSKLPFRGLFTIFDIRRTPWIYGFLNINPSKTNGLSHRYRLDGSTFTFVGFRSNLEFLFQFWKKFLKENRIAPYGTPQHVASQLVLRCLPKCPIKWTPRLYKLTHKSLASLLWDINKQHSPRCDATERGVPSGATLFA